MEKMKLRLNLSNIFVRCKWSVVLVPEQNPRASHATKTRSSNVPTASFGSSNSPPTQLPSRAASFAYLPTLGLYQINLLYNALTSRLTRLFRARPPTSHHGYTIQTQLDPTYLRRHRPPHRQRHHDTVP